MKYGTTILAVMILATFSFECGAQRRTTGPETRDGTGESATFSPNQEAIGSRITVPPRGTVINTQTLTITGAIAGETFSPVVINTQTLTITGAMAGEAFSPIGINTRTLTITGSPGGQ